MNKAKRSNIFAASQSSVSALIVLVALSGLCLIVASRAELVDAISLADQANGDTGRQQSGPTLALVENPEVTVRVLESLLRSILYSATAADLQATTNIIQKRGLDLGISRGFSGSQAGKHLMGLSAASFANGPGR